MQPDVTVRTRHATSVLEHSGRHKATWDRGEVCRGAAHPLGSAGGEVGQHEREGAHKHARQLVDHRQLLEDGARILEGRQERHVPAQTRQSGMNPIWSQSGCVVLANRSTDKVTSTRKGLYLSLIAGTNFEEGKSLEGRQEAQVSYARKLTDLLRMRVASLTNTLGNPSANFLHVGTIVSYIVQVGKDGAKPIFARSASARMSHIRVKESHFVSR